MSELKLPQYGMIADLFGQAEAVVTVSEVHGMLCGIICAGKRMHAYSWLDPISSFIEAKHKFIDVVRQLLIKLYAVSGEQLRDLNLPFRLLLPNDEEELPNRVEAMALWCEGFLSGLGLAEINQQSCAHEEINEAIKDLIEISQVDYENIAQEESDEIAYTEIVEYVRVLVIMIYNELQNAQVAHSSHSGELLH